ncbi:MAG TPA: thioredoxin family protein [Pyrinomonadaceae bacterium]|nr:thioredoxin family protein [Pyrinomonadaceae bacterium]
MKTLSLSLIAVLLFSVSALSQDPGPKKPAKKAVAVIPREKFDPKRDPNADLASAVESASKNGKRIILDVGGEWCGWCVLLDKYLYQTSSLRKLRDTNFIWVKINMSEENENEAFLASYPEIQGYPHLFVLDETGKLLHSQDTSVLEKGNGYDLPKFTAFLKKWAPKGEKTLK